MATEELWEPDDASARHSRQRSDRVRGLYLQARQRAYGGTEHLSGCSCRACGRFRGDLARDWVRVAEEAGLHVPGQDERTPLREGETSHGRRVDAARTRIRQFEMGQPQAEWVLCGLETTLADRAGLAYPPCAYETQGTLV